MPEAAEICRLQSQAAFCFCSNSFTAIPSYPLPPDCVNTESHSAFVNYLLAVQKPTYYVILSGVATGNAVEESSAYQISSIGKILRLVSLAQDDTCGVYN